MHSYRKYVIVDDFPLPPIHSDDYGISRAIFSIIHDDDAGGKAMRVPAGHKVRRFNESVPPMRKRLP